MILTR